MYKISIVIPVYNAKKYIDRCLKSLIKQTEKNIEIILVNDGSKDNSLEILNKYKKDNKNIKVYDQINKGPGAARNLGISKAKSKYIGFVDIDDYIHKDMYKLMLEEIEKSNSDIVICDYYAVHNNKEKYKSNGTKEMYSNLKINPHLLNIIDSCPWNKLYKRELFDNYKFKEDIKYEDFEVIPKVLYAADKISKIDKALYYYVYNFEGESLTISNKLFDIFIVLESLIKYYKSKKVSIKFITELEYLTIRKLLMYNEKALYLKDKKDIKIFLNKSFTLLNKHFKNWRNNYYFNNNKDKLKNMIIKTKHPLIWYILHYIKIKIKK